MTRSERSWLLCVGLLSGAIVPLILIAYIVTPTIMHTSLYGPVELTSIIGGIIGSVALGGVWGLIWLAVVFRVFQGRWPWWRWPW